MQLRIIQNNSHAAIKCTLTKRPLFSKGLSNWRQRIEMSSRDWFLPSRTRILAFSRSAALRT